METLQRRNFEMNDIPRGRPNFGALSARFPAFSLAHEQIVALAHYCFRNDYPLRTPSERLCSSLGEDCCEDFQEIIHLADGDFTRGTLKLIRTLYERSITISTIAYEAIPEKRERLTTRFVDYQWLNWEKVYKGAMRVLGDEGPATWDALDHCPNRQKIEREVNRVSIQVKARTHRCSSCGFTQTLKSTLGKWGPTPDEMAKALGGSWESTYMPAYIMPNMIIHPSVFDLRYPLADANVPAAMYMLLSAVKAQNFLLELNLYDVIGSTERKINDFGHQVARYLNGQREKRGQAG